MLDFATANPGWTFMIVLALCSAAGSMARYAFKTYKLRLHAKNIAAHGWPLSTSLDAGGECSRRLHAAGAGDQ